MERTAENEHFRTEVIEQWIFDLYVKECIDCMKNKTWMHMEETKKLLQALMIKSLDPDFPGNRAKSQLLNIVFSVKQLVHLGVGEVSDEEENGLALDDNTNIFEVLDGLQSSLDYFYRKTDEPEAKENSRKCLFNTYVFLVEKVCQQLASDENDTEVIEALKTCLAKTLSMISSVVKKESKSEMQITEVCEKLVKKLSLSKHLPSGSDLIDRVTELVLDIHGAFDPPLLLEFAATYIKKNPKILERFQEREKEEFFSDTRVNKEAEIDTFLEERGINTDPDDDEIWRRMEAVKEKARKVRLKRQLTGSSSVSRKHLMALVNRNTSNRASSSPSQDSDGETSSLEGGLTASSRGRNMAACSSKHHETSSHSPSSSPLRKKVKKSSRTTEGEDGKRRRKSPGTHSPTPSDPVSSTVSLKDRSKRMREEGNKIRGRKSLLEFGKNRKPKSHSSAHLGRWTPSEEYRFILGTLECGEGNWAEIKEAIDTPRSSVQLKDKWRTIPESQINSVAKEHGLVYRKNKNRRR